MGDYDSGGYHMKGNEPVICKKFRRIFRNAGYQTYLVNEFRTSMPLHRHRFFWVKPFFKRLNYVVVVVMY